MTAILRVEPSPGLRGTVYPPGDKSISHRAILLAGMARGQSHIDHVLVAGVTQPMMDALRELGATLYLEGETLTVQSPGFRAWKAPARPLFCGHSATTMRLLAGALAAAGVPAVLDGSPGLRRRPMRRIVTPLRQMGVPIQDTEGHAPLILEARPANRPLKGGTFLLPVASAQVKSALLLAGLAAAESVEIVEPGPSRDHTERLLRGLGVDVQTFPGYRVRMVPPKGDLPGFRLQVPGDISAAAFLVVAALITPGSELRIEHVGLNPTRTGLLEALQAMGAAIDIFPQGDEAGEPVATLQVRYTPHLHGTRVAGPLVVRMIDEFPVFGVAAAYAQGETEVRDAAELRHKESDRIAHLVEALQALGVDAEERPDGFVVRGKGRVRGGRVHAHNDHRLAMAMAVAGLASQEGVVVEDGGIYRESFPAFPQVLARLGARISEEAQ